VAPRCRAADSKGLLRLRPLVVTLAVVALSACSPTTSSSTSSTTAVSTTTAATFHSATLTQVEALPFPVAYTTTDGSASGAEDVWVAGKGRLPTRVARTEGETALGWSNNGRYLVTLLNPYTTSPSVWRYDDATGAIATWRCGSCEDVAVVGSEIVAVDSHEQLLRFPLSGGPAESAVAITGLPEWARIPLPKGVFADAVGGTTSAALLAWPISAGALDVWGSFVLVALDGRYLRTVGPPGKTSVGVSLGRALYGGVAMAPDDQSALLSEASEISACENGGNLARLPLTKPGDVNYPNPPGPKGTDADPLSLAIDSAGNSWAVFTATRWVITDGSGPHCGRTPPQLYRWTGPEWTIEKKDVLGVAFGPQDWMVLVQGHLTTGRGQPSGTLIVDEPGHQVAVATGVTSVTVPR
jgi:hypothetical protein